MELEAKRCRLYCWKLICDILVELQDVMVLVFWLRTEWWEVPKSIHLDMRRQHLFIQEYEDSNHIISKLLFVDYIIIHFYEKYI